VCAVCALFVCPHLRSSVVRRGVFVFHRGCVILFGWLCGGGGRVVGWYVVLLCRVSFFCVCVGVGLVLVWGGGGGGVDEAALRWMTQGRVTTSPLLTQR